MSAATWWRRQSERWKEEKREWRTALQRCPIAEAAVGGGRRGEESGDAGSDDRGGGGGRWGGSTTGEERERESALKARLAVAFITASLALYVFVKHLVKHNGTPYYFIYLTNWTGMLAVVYTALAAYAASVGHGSRREGGLEVSQVHIHSSSPQMTATRELEMSQTMSRQPSASSNSSLSRPRSEDDDDNRDDNRDDDRDGNRDDNRDDVVPRHIHVLWPIKAVAPVAQVFITVYWGQSYRPQYGPVTVSSVFAHGAIAFVLVADYLLLNRLRLGNVYDVLYAYAYAFLYIAFNVVYTLWIPEATNPDGGGVDGVEGERNYVLRELSFADGNQWVYRILDWRSHTARAGYVIGVSLVFLVPLCWGLMCGVATLRDRWLFPLRSRRSHAQRGDGVRSGEESQRVARDEVTNHAAV